MRRLLVLLLPAVAALVIAGSLMPVRTKFLFGTETRVYIVGFYGHGMVVNPHRLFHWMAFGTLTLLASAAGSKVWQRLAAACAVFLTSVAVEYAQHRVYLNGFEWRDLQDDAIAVVMASILVQAVVWWKRKRESGSMR